MFGEDAEARTGSLSHVPREHCSVGQPMYVFLYILQSCDLLTCTSANVDWAMLNFMADWFPIESKKKLRQNEREVAEEELEELGIDNPNCIVM